MWKSTWATVVALLLAGPAACLEPGDLLVGVDASLFVVDPDTGAIELLSPDPSFGSLPSTIAGVVATPAGGEVFVALASFFLPTGSVWRVDPEGGARTLIAELASGRSPGGIAIDAEGELWVPHGLGVSRIDPRSGAELLLGALPPGSDATGIVIEANGDLLVSSYQLFAGLSRVVRIEPGAPGFASLSGVRGGLFSGIALESDGSVLVPVKPGGGTVPPLAFSGLLRIDPESGARELVSTDGLIRDPTDLAVESSGDIVVSTAPSPLAAGAIVRIDPRDGSQTLLVEHPALHRASAIAVVPPPEVVIDVLSPSLVLPSRGTLPVALSGSSELDVTEIDPAGLAFGPGGAAPVRSLRVGRRGDAHPDLLLLFRAAEAGFQPGDTQACLSGSTARFDFEACDAIRVRSR